MDKSSQPHIDIDEKTIPAQRELLSDAEDANNNEHDLSFTQAIKLYPKAVGWSVMMSCALVMDGYDLKLIGSLFAQPAFQKSYGKEQPDGTYQIPAPWQSGLNNGSNVGQMLGLLIAGTVVERFGFRKTMMGALTVLPCLIFIQFFAPNLPQLQAGQILIGMPLGMFQTVTCVYAIELMPTSLRAYLTSFVNMCWLLGQLVASGTLRGTLSMPAPWAYRVPFAVQWAWPIPLLVGVLLAPESPWWLVRQNRLEDAKAVVRRLTSPKRNPDFDIDKNVALMVLTTEHEREANSDTRFISCFKGTDLRRTIIVIGCYCMQVLSGSTLRSYATYFLQSAGLPTDQAFNMTIVGYGLGIAGVMVSWLLMPHVGRRTLFLWGLAILTLIMLLVGGLGVAQRSPSTVDGLPWGIGALLLLSLFISNVAVGPVSYALVSEIPSSLLRSKSVVMARFCYATINIIANVITPYQLNPSAWGWGAISGFFWAGSAAIGWGFTYVFIPEPKGRTVAELDLLFERQVPARKFAKTEVRLVMMVGGKATS
ncbi:uncharacterized protein HMPREF1541_10665 [Cyphellophora europaea CBS 101466]|uniref:Major facilitator superfamily (MFS) profile domain-containing protein n=1 Tax=Cyphellophora europaea (strain CBS 101466) TaxID=1220924 RepID=W2S667_CYPE1|nr:uncharacterized protein HMPREF1541_10665 [Cyphellophora europaea CBS 101466]ETN44115.1 hypothetical protein HMPREF1541_10665 [Cyphellophora europaea CBS 101466]